MPYKPLHALFEIHECAHCATVYCDPWLGARGMARLYGVGHGQHLAGWENFLRWVQGPAAPGPLSPSSAIWAFLDDRAGPIDVYGELNCPFGGLFMLFRDLEAGKRDKLDEAAQAIARVLHSQGYPAGLRARLAGLRGRAAALARRLPGMAQPSALQVARLKRALARSTGIGPSRTPQRPAAPARPRLPRQRYLVVEPTSAFWSTNCTAFGAACRAVCQSSAVGVPVLDWKDVDREGTRFDVFGLFNCLDHFIDPARALREALARSHAVLVEGHRSGPDDTFSRQHLFALGPRFLDHILPDGWRWEDVTPRLDDGLQSYYWIERS